MAKPKPKGRQAAKENPNTPVAPETKGGVPFAERDEVTENPNTPVAPETKGGVPFAGGEAAADAEAEE